jgi:hypothetical protein
MNDPEFNYLRTLLDEINEVFVGFFLADIFPALKDLPTPGISLLKKKMRELTDFLGRQIAEHKETFDESENQYLLSCKINNMKT